MKLLDASVELLREISEGYNVEDALRRFACRLREELGLGELYFVFPISVGVAWKLTGEGVWEKVSYSDMPVSVEDILTMGSARKIELLERNVCVVRFVFLGSTVALCIGMLEEGTLNATDDLLKAVDIAGLVLAQWQFAQGVRDVVSSAVKLLIAGDREALLRRVLNIASETMGAQASSIIFLDDQGVPYFEIALGPKGYVIEKKRLPPHKGIYGRVLDSGKPLLVEDVRKSKSWLPIIDDITGFRTVSILAFPIRVGGKPVGVLELVNKKTKSDLRFSQEDLRLGEVFSSIIEVALQNLELYAHMEELMKSLIVTMVNAVDERDPYTRGHSLRVAKLSVAIAMEMGLSGKDIKNIELAALFHDIGKIGIPDSILKKPENLTEEEYDLIKKHPEKGRRILEPIKQLKPILPLIEAHHERWDGKGYPRGLKGEEIPVGAQIIAVADAFDALTSQRPYGRKVSVKEAVRRILEGRGKQFNPNVVDAIKALYEKGVLEKFVEEASEGDQTILSFIGWTPLRGFCSTNGRDI